MKIITFVALLAVVLLTGCKPDFPVFDSASVEVYSGGRVTASGVLAESQIQGVREWIAERRTGWEYRIESTAPEFLVKLERKGEVVAHMNIMSKSVKIGDFFRPITPQERDALHLLLTTFLNPKG